MADYDMVMPFLTVASKGGPHDDESYVAGWEMGKLDAELAATRPPLLEQPIHSTNAAQADLVAMKHGYTATITEQGDGWSWLCLRPSGDALHNTSEEA